MLRKSKCFSLFLITTAFVFIVSKNSNANFYAGLGFDLGVTFYNSNAPEFNSKTAEAIKELTAFNTKLITGLDLRVGYECVVISRMYLAAELYSRFMFDISGHGRRDSDQPYISGGIALKIGATFNEKKTKAYIIAMSEYIAGGVNLDKALVGQKIHQIGLVLVGVGLGMKQEILPFLALFVEIKMVFDVFAHISQTFVKTHTDENLHTSGSTGYQLVNFSIGMDFLF